MISREEMLEKMLAKVADKVAQSVKETLTEAMEGELSSNMSKALLESEFLRRLTDEMRTGLKNIYQEIPAASQAEGAQEEHGRTKRLFTDVATKLEEVMQTTEEATEKILATLEELLARQAEAGKLLASLKQDGIQKEALDRLAQLNDALAASLTDTITDLSFHDLNGQRLKKVVEAIGTIRETVFDLYLSTGLIIKTHEAVPDKDLSELAEESRRVVREIRQSELKGPTLGTTQKDVDDLLTNLGL